MSNPCSALSTPAARLPSPVRRLPEGVPFASLAAARAAHPSAARSRVAPAPGRPRLAWLPLLALLAAAGCGGTLKDARGVNLQEPEITFLDVREKSGSGAGVSAVGTMTVLLGVRNPNSVPVTLERLEIQVRGAEELRHERRTHQLDRRIDPGEAAQVPVDLLFTLDEARPNIYASLPRLTLTGTARFSSPQGVFQTSFVQAMERGQR
jgi:hypothetical protein